MELIDNTAKHNNASCRSTGSPAFSPADIGRQGVAIFFDDNFCRGWILKRLHPEGPRCPGCAERIVGYRSLQSFMRGDRVKCCHCGKYFTALTGTFISGCHLSFPQVILMAILLEAGTDDVHIARMMNISYESVRGWRSRFAVISGQGIKESRGGAARGGVVVADEVSL